MNAAILPTSYLGTITYYSNVKRYENCFIEKYENLPKQSIRSRCTIYSPNGAFMMSIPLVKRNHRQTMMDVKISYDSNWQKLHWRTLESSYRRSPFFEYYEDDLQPFYHNRKYEFLIDFNTSLHEKILELLKLKRSLQFTNEYTHRYPNAIDLRDAFSEKKKETKTSDLVLIPYLQVFEVKYGFLPNLSILDLLFNTGSKALNYI